MTSSDRVGDRRRENIIGQPASSTPIRILRWQVVVLGGVVVVAVTVSVMAWLWLEAGGDRRLRIDAVRTGFTVGFGVGGSLALALAARRQWLQERAQADQEARAAVSQAHQERIATASEHDARERRITELYVKAVEQLGSVTAPVRLGGLFALERLAEVNPDHRRTVCAVICAYLRMPFSPPDKSSGDAGASASGTAAAVVEGSASEQSDHARRCEELQVRLTAQRILAAHLRDEVHSGDGDHRDTAWPEIDFIDLTGAHLVDFTLQHCRVGTLQLNGATLSGESVFRGTTCSIAFVQGATFTGWVDFRGATFTEDAWFAYSTFAGDTWFHTDEFYQGARFGRHASFKGASFVRDVLFSGASFAHSVDFSEIDQTAAQHLHLEGAHVDRPDAASVWPPGWTLDAGGDSHGTLIRERTRGNARHDDGSDG